VVFQSSLDAPENVVANEETKVLTWSGVLFSSGYVVSIDGKEIRVNGKSYSLADLTEPKIYFIKVKAVNDKYSNAESDWSKTAVYVIYSEYETGSLAFELIDDGTAYSVSAGTAANRSAVIPSEYNGLPVTEIAENGFYKDYYIKTVVIPDSVTTIGDEAFQSCSNLINIEMPAAVVSYGLGVFRYCGKLTSIKIPNGVTFIEDKAFVGCGSLTSVVIPDSVVSIGDEAFISCVLLTSVVIPDSVTRNTLMGIDLKKTGLRIVAL
jgi:hypothetical protein